MNTLFVRTLAYALLMHEVLYVCRDGRDYLTRSFLPTLGLRLSPRAYAMLHVAFMGVCLWLSVFPEQWIFYPLLLSLLSAVIASYSLRVSNHLVLSWFMLVLLCVATFLQPADQRGTRAPALLLCGVQWLVVLTYFFSFLHKLNADFLSLERSCATQLADFFCWDRGVHRPAAVRAVRYAAVYGTLLAEGLVPLCLVVPPLMPLGLMLGLSFHFALGLLGIINFSVIMYAGLSTFVTPATLDSLAVRLAARDAVPLAIAAAACLLAVWVVTPRHANRHCPYAMRGPAWLCQFGFGLVSAALLCGAWQLLQGPAAPSVDTSSLSASERGWLGLVLLAFTLNGAAPYLGLKTEFSFAMFSNLRHEPWRHLLFPASWKPFNLCSYVRVERLEGLPELDPAKETSATRMAMFLLSQTNAYAFSSYFFREAIRLVRHAARGPARIRVVFTERDRRFEVEDFDERAEGNLLTRLRANLFPFVMPLDPDAPHSEQGSVRKQGERQMF